MAKFVGKTRSTCFPRADFTLEILFHYQSEAVKKEASESLIFPSKNESSRIEFKMKGRFQSFLSSFLSKTTWIFFKLFCRLQGNFLKTP